MNCNHLQTLADLRVKEARVLLDNGYFIRFARNAIGRQYIEDVYIYKVS